MKPRATLAIVEAAARKMWTLITMAWAANRNHIKPVFFIITIVVMVILCLSTALDAFKGAGFWQLAGRYGVVNFVSGLVFFWILQSKLSRLIRPVNPSVFFNFIVAFFARPFFNLTNLFGVFLRPAFDPLKALGLMQGIVFIYRSLSVCWASQCRFLGSLIMAILASFRIPGNCSRASQEHGNIFCFATTAAC